MICLIDRPDNTFRGNYPNLSPEDIVNMMPDTVAKILRGEEIPQDKITVFKNRLSFIRDDIDLNNSNGILKEILDILKDNVIPLFGRKSNYDIIGKFYEEFLKYAGISNVKKGIVLTPNHITALFTDLIPLKMDDVILDPCCGTGAFFNSGNERAVR